MVTLGVDASHFPLYCFFKGGIRGCFGFVVTLGVSMRVTFPFNLLPSKEGIVGCFGVCGNFGCFWCESFPPLVPFQGRDCGLLWGCGNFGCVDASHSICSRRAMTKIVSTLASS